jgi:MIF4G domain
MQMATANISQPASTGMNQVPPEIMTVMSLRGVYRASGNRATFPDESLKTIADIRADLPAAAANGDGLQKINNWRERSGGGGERSGHGGERSGERSGGGHGGERSGHGGERSGHGAPRGSRMPTRQGAMTNEGRYSNQPNVARNTVSAAFGGRNESKAPGTGNTFGPARYKNSSAQSTAFGSNSASVAPQTSSATVMSVAGVPTTPSGTSPAVPLVSPTQAAAAPPTPQAQPSRYVSKFKNSAEPVEKTIVNTLIRGKLNKFSQDNYEDIKEFLMVILETGDEDPNFLGDFMKLIFTKAAEEEIYCPFYAQLLRDLSERFPYLIEEMTTLFKRFMGIFEEVSEKSVENYSDLLERNKEKRYRTGYSQFMAELFKLGIIDHTSFMDTCTLIVHQLRMLVDQVDKLNTVEEYVGCLNKIMIGLKGNVPSEIKELVSTLSDLTVKGVVKASFSSKVRFAIMDVINIGS